MKKLVLACAAVAVVFAAAAAFAQDRPAEPPAPKAAEPAAPAPVPAPAEKPAEKARPEESAPAKKPEEAAPAAVPAPVPVPKEGEKPVPSKAEGPAAKPAEAAPVPAPVPVPKEAEKPAPGKVEAPAAKPAETAPSAAPAPAPLDGQKPVGTPVPSKAEGAPAAPAAVERPAPAKVETPAAVEVAPTKAGEGEGVKATVEKKEEKVEGVQHIGGQTFYTEERTWYGGSTAVYTNATGVNPDIPYYTMSLKLLPKINVTDEFLITGRLDLIKEITNGVTYTAKREMQFGDGRIELVHTNLYKEKYSGIQFSGLFRFQIPTSKASQYATLQLGTMADLGVGRTFFKDKLSVGYDFRFYKFFHKYTTSEVQSAKGGTYVDEKGNLLPIRVPTGEYLNTGELNVSYQFAHIFAASYAFTEKLSAIVYFWVINGVTYEPTGGGPRGNRDSLDFNVEVDYMVTKWFVVDVGVDTSQPQLTPDSTYPSNPFWRNTASNFTTVYFDIGFVL